MDFERNDMILSNSLIFKKKTNQRNTTSSCINHDKKNDRKFVKLVKLVY